MSEGGWVTHPCTPVAQFAHVLLPCLLLLAISNESSAMIAIRLFAAAQAQLG
jgi:hypothetical protein